MSKQVVFTLVAFLLVTCGYSQKPNVCSTYEDYQNMENNTKCWYNPDVDREMFDIIKARGYPVEVHNITTEDGFFIGLYRIRKDNAKCRVLLQHPALTGGNVWIDKGNDSLAFQLYEEGYDIWIGNSRGNRYSFGHVNMSTNLQEYWDNGGLHEMGLYDTGAELEFIRNHTGTANDPPNICYIGHSMGGTLMTIYGSLRPEKAMKAVKVAIYAGPGINLRNANAPFLDLAKSVSSKILETILYGLNIYFIAPKTIDDLLKYFCMKDSEGIQICLDFIYYIMGTNTHLAQVAPQWAPLVFSLNPAGTPVRVAMHYLQMAQTQRFQMYDYGKLENLKRYNSETPPLYPLEEYGVPTLFFTGSEDYISYKMDVQEQVDRMKPSAKKYGHYTLPGFNHFDFIYGKQLNIFQKLVIKFLNKITRNKS